MQPVNNIILDTFGPQDGTWRDISNFGMFSVQVIGLEGNVWVEASNDPTASSATAQAAAINTTAAPGVTFVAALAKGAGPNGVTSIRLQDPGVGNGNDVTPVAVVSEAITVNIRHVNNTIRTLTEIAALFAGAVSTTAAGVITGFVTGTGANPAVAGTAKFFTGGATATNAITGINVTGNLVAGGTATSEGEIMFDNTNKQAMWNASCLFFNFVRVRKSGGGSKETIAYLFGQNG